MADCGNIPAAVRKPANTQNTCRYHCCACNAHFKSLVAFDAHRTPEFTCADPDDVRGMYLQCVGTCDLLVHGRRTQGADLWAYVAPRKGQ